MSQDGSASADIKLPLYSCYFRNFPSLSQSPWFPTGNRFVWSAICLLQQIADSAGKENGSTSTRAIAITIRVRTHGWC